MPNRFLLVFVALFLEIMLLGCPRSEEEQAEEPDLVLPPIAIFTTTLEDRGTGTVAFTNHSFVDDEASAQFSWDFGDGSPLSTEFEPRHSYAIPGSYRVTLIASNSPSSSDTVTSTVDARAFVVRFRADEQRGVAPHTVTFQDRTVLAGFAPTYTWDFGDGSPTSAEQNPAHVYTQAGVYTVSLRIDSQNANGSFFESATLTDFITVDAPLGLRPHDPLPAASNPFDLEISLRRRWPGPQFSYAASNADVAAAFETWNAAISLDMVPVTTGTADSELDFGRGTHCGAYQRYLTNSQNQIGCRSGFLVNPNHDGPEGFLAHSYSYWEPDTSNHIPGVPGESRLAFDEPVSGDIHLDGDELFTSDATSTTEIRRLEVVLHQIGHVLGLPHSPNADSIMFHLYDPTNPKTTLSPEDLANIRALYGRDGPINGTPPQQPSLPVAPSIQEVNDLQAIVFTPDDNDGDGLDDATEMFVLASHTVPSIDTDGLFDPIEVQFHLDPHRPDSDYDGNTDDEEIAGFDRNGPVVGDPFIPDQNVATDSRLVGRYVGADDDGNAISLTIFPDGSAEGSYSIQQYGWDVDVPLIGSAVDLSFLGFGLRLVSYDQRILVGGIFSGTSGFTVISGDVEFLGGEATRIRVTEIR